MKLQRRILVISLIAVVAGVAFTASLASGRAGAQRKPPVYPRAQTLITGGTQWGNIQGFNPFFNAYAVGTVGLCNETLLRYDPLKDEYINWLAESAGFTGKKTYTVKVRPKIRWSNGQKFSGKDVAWNFKLGRFSTAFWHDLDSSLKSIRAKGLTVTFKFRKTPNYIQWQNLIWNLPMANPKQARAIRSAASLEEYGQEAPIGTGPYTLDPAGYDPTTRVVWKKKAVWWAAEQGIAPSPKPKYVIDLCATSNACHICGAVEDLVNKYFPGIQDFARKGAARTYYSKPPYHLSASTAWLIPNTSHKPLDDRAFRRALASSIDVGRIVNSVYGKLVLPASPTGLLPTWKKWIDGDLVKSKGFSFNTARARNILASAGYRDVNGDGYVENEDGSTIDLKITVPQGWSDWESARDIITASANAAGIHLHKDEGDYNHWTSERNSGLFDLVIDNPYQLSDNPWTYYDGIFHLPTDAGRSANIERYNNPIAWSFVRKLDKTPPTNPGKRKKLVSKLQGILMNDLPVIPLWYPGIWSHVWSHAYFSDDPEYWTNWPSSTSKRNYTPSMWRGYMQMTGIDMITHLKPKG